MIFIKKVTLFLILFSLPLASFGDNHSNTNAASIEALETVHTQAGGDDDSRINNSQSPQGHENTGSTLFIMIILSVGAGLLGGATSFISRSIATEDNPARKPKSAFHEILIGISGALCVPLLLELIGSDLLSNIFADREFETFFVYFGFCVVAATMTRRMIDPKRIDLQLKEMKEDRDEARLRVESEPEKITPVWEQSRIHLEEYILRNQSHVKSIFNITVAVMVIGFFIMAYGIIRIFSNDSIKPATITMAGGILTEFIGATLLIVYKSTIAQAASYVSTLERINSVGMSLQIVDQIPDEESDLKIKTKADIASKILDVSFHQTSSKKK